MEKGIERHVTIITENNDFSTDKVIDWLYYYGENFKRNNVDKNFTNFKILVSNEKIYSNLESHVIWNRRGYLPIIPLELRQTNWITYLKEEQLVVLTSIEKLNKNKYIGSYLQEKNNNKILNLKLAIEAGLRVPSTIVTNNRVDLLNFIRKNKKYITKSLYYPPYLETSKYVYTGNGTIEIDFENISEEFAPSLIQEYVEKEIEIRIFFMENNFYPMAIFSQNDETTKIDYRNYNYEKPNRNVPFVLPKLILKKIKKFISKLEINTGSIDLIINKKGDYFFLEINPMGQYDWVSQNCNYYIDKDIAEILISKLNNGK